MDQVLAGPLEILEAQDSVTFDDVIQHLTKGVVETGHRAEDIGILHECDLRGSSRFESFLV